ncbi:MAG: toxin-antitoxin system HicB family antitoxin [Candidatus Woesearchaeota archaeon]|jgi:predicted HicB family RNase H-like nuclease
MTRRQLNIRIDDELHTKAKVTAILKGITLNDYIEQAIKESLEKDKTITSKTKKL